MELIFIFTLWTLKMMELLNGLLLAAMRESFYALAHLDGENTKVFLMNHPDQNVGSIDS